jgi:hypothetical protein
MHRPWHALWDAEIYTIVSKSAFLHLGEIGLCRRAGGLVWSYLSIGANLIHWPSKVGYLLSSKSCWAATGPPINTMAAVTQPVMFEAACLPPIHVTLAQTHGRTGQPTQRTGNLEGPTDHYLRIGLLRSIWGQK